MTFWRLASPEHFTDPALSSHHIVWLCLLAFLIASFSSSVLLTVMQRYQQTTGKARTCWLATGSIVMGTGIWAMHFTGMLAFSLPVPVSYSWIFTLASVVPPILVSTAFQILYRPDNMSRSRMLSIALIFAAGVGGMHYIGMEAVVVAADMHYEPRLFALSLLAAVVLAYCAIYAQSRMAVQTQFSSTQIRVVGSMTLGLAVTLMHFIAMSATYFQPNEFTVLGLPTSAPIGLAIQVFGVAAVLLLIAGISILVDHRMEEISARLDFSEARFQRLAESTKTAIFTLSEERISYANPAFCQMTGLGLEELCNRPLAEVFDSAFEQDIVRLIEGKLGEDGVAHQEIKLQNSEGNTLWLFCSLTLQEDDENTLVLASAFDITEQKKAAIEVQNLAYEDHLTKLSNRILFIDRLQHYLNSTERHESNRSACVMILDLDGFKQINDSLGHLAGDMLLITVAERLQNLARKSDTISRFGGDEFVLLFEQAGKPLNIGAIAERIQKTLSETVLLDEREIEIVSSIGIVAVTRHYKSPDEVLHDADVALYRAKDIGEGGWVLFNEELDAAAKRERQLLPELKHAIEEGLLDMFFQPICRSADGAVCGFEALARWTRDNGECIGPDEFIPLAEESGLIHDIGLWSLECAAMQIQQLNRLDGDVNYYVSVNLDANTLDDSRFLGKVVSVFRDCELRPGQIKIELTERGLIKDTAAIIPKMHELIAEGCEFMIDDFGTGYSSLSYLHKLPIHTLKIDRSFVTSLEESGNSVAVVKTIITLAESLGLNVVAEGVETVQNVVQLASLDCHQLQGYFFSRPMPASEVVSFLEDSRLLISTLFQQALKFPERNHQPLN